MSFCSHSSMHACACRSKCPPSTLCQAPWAEGMFPWWFDKHVMYNCRWQDSTQYPDLTDHRSFFWTWLCKHHAWRFLVAE